MSFQKLFGKKTCPLNPGIESLESAVKVVAGAIRGALLAGVTLGNPIALLIAYGQVLPDLFRLLSNVENLPCEIESLNSKDLERLIETLIYEFGVSSTAASGLLKQTLIFLQYINLAGKAGTGIMDYLDKSAPL